MAKKKTNCSVSKSNTSEQLIDGEHYFLDATDRAIQRPKNKEEQEILKEILNTEFKDKCIPLDDLNIRETLPIIKNCDISICNDSSFSHLSSGLGIKTIVLMADTPLIYGNYSSKMYPIIPDGENTVTHNTLGKDKINPNKIFDQLNILQHRYSLQMYFFCL